MTTSNNHLKIAKAYYQAMLNKDLEAISDYLAENVHIISPLGEVNGKPGVLEAAQNLMKLLHDINFRTECAFDDHVVMVYDFLFPEPVGKLRAAGWLSFANDKIVNIELFYDGRPFERMKQQIFSKHSK